MSASERGLDRIEAQRRECPEIENIELHLVFVGEVVGDIGGESDHFTVGYYGGEVAGGNVAGFPH